MLREDRHGLQERYCTCNDTHRKEGWATHLSGGGVQICHPACQTDWILVSCLLQGERTLMQGATGLLEGIELLAGPDMLPAGIDRLLAGG